MSTSIASISNTKLKVRWQQPYTSEALNQALAVLNRGIYFGFTLSPDVAALSIDIDVDPNFGFSQLIYRDSADGLVLSVIESGQVVLDLSAVAGTTVYIGVEVDYEAGSTTTAAYTAYTTAEFDAGLGDTIVLGKVVVPALGVISSGAISAAGAVYPWSERADSIGADRWIQSAHVPLEISTNLSQWFPGASIDSNLTASIGSGDESVYAIQIADFNISAGVDSFSVPVTGLVPVEPGDAVVVRWRMRYGDVAGGAETVTATSLGVFCQFYDEDGSAVGTTVYGGDSPSAASDTGWNDFEEFFDAPATSKYAIFGYSGLSVDGSGGNSGVLFERVRVYAPSHRDGAREAVGSNVHAGAVTVGGLSGAIQTRQTSSTEFAVEFHGTGTGTILDEVDHTFTGNVQVQDVNFGDSSGVATPKTFKRILLANEIQGRKKYDSVDGYVSASAETVGGADYFTYIGVGPTEVGGNIPILVHEEFNGYVGRRLTNVRLGVSATTSTWTVLVERTAVGTLGTMATQETLSTSTSASIGSIDEIDLPVSGGMTIESGYIYGIDVYNDNVGLDKLYWIEFTFEADSIGDYIGG